MESGCCLSCFNCCFFNCFDSFSLSIFQMISSLLGIGANSLIFSLSKKINDSSNFIFSTQVINISFFAGGTTISIILAILKKMEKLDQGCFYKFGMHGSKIYSTISKLLILLNIIGFFYLISFTPFLMWEITIEGGQEMFNITSSDYLGEGKEIEYFVRYKNKTFYCEKYGCPPNYIFPEDKPDNYGDVFLVLFYSILSCLIMFFNGESFSSDSKRIKFLSSGKLSLQFKPIEIATAMCNRENSFDLLNLLFCYKATIFNVEALISTFSCIIFFFSLFTLVYVKKLLWIQAYFVDNGFIYVPLFSSVLCFFAGLCCERCCDRFQNPKCKKCYAIIILVINFMEFPILLIDLPMCVGSQTGSIKYRADCDKYASNTIYHSELYESLCHEDYEYKYLLFIVKRCSSKIVCLVFVLVAGEIILTFYLIVLFMNYVQRIIPEFGSTTKAYNAVMYLIENNGDKICVDDIKIECEEKTMTKNKGGKEIEYKNYIYKRILPPVKNVPVVQNLQIIYLSES